MPSDSINKEKTKSHLGDKAIAAISERAHSAGVPAAIALGLLPLQKYVRHLSEQNPVKNNQEMEALLDKLTAQAGNPSSWEWNPNKLNDAGKEIPIGLHQIFERGKPARDILAVRPGISVPTVAHEAGHAHAPNKVESILKRVAPVLAHPAAMSAPSLLALTALFNKEKANPVAKAAPYIGALQLATIMAEEGRANIRGQGLLAGIGQGLSGKEKAKMFLPLLTYLGYSLPLIAAPAGILKGIEKYHEAKNKGRDVSAKRTFFHPPSAISKLPSPEEIKKKWSGRI